MLVVAIKSVSALQCTQIAPVDGGRLCHEEVSPAKKKSFTISSTDRQPLFSFYVSAQVEAVWQFGSQLAPRQQRQRQLELLSEAMTLGCGCRCWHFRLVIATNFFIRTSEIEKPFHWTNISCSGRGAPKYWVEERKVSTFVASLPTLATSRARHKWQLSTDNTDCYSTSTSAWQLQMAEGHIDVSFCPSDYGSMCIKLAKINYKTGLSN